MEIVRKPFTQTSSQQGVIASTSIPSPKPVDSGFSAFLQGVVTPDAANKVSEEELFSALVQQRIQRLKGEDALKKFQETLTETKESMRRHDGAIPVEDATKAALIKAREAGLLTKEETDKVYSESFAAAQLDDNKELLFDGRGGGADATVAVALFEQAMLGASGMIEKFDDGSLTATIRSVEEDSAGKILGARSPHSESGGSGGFLFKPRADTNGKLVVLMPSKLASMVSSVKLYDPAGNLIETGRYTGNGNGGRDHYRFKRSGGDYPDGLYVVASLRTGDTVLYRIKETSQRTENISPVTDVSDSSGAPSEYDGSSTDTPSSVDDNPESL